MSSCFHLQCHLWSPCLLRKRITALMATLFTVFDIRCARRITNSLVWCPTASDVKNSESTHARFSLHFQNAPVLYIAFHILHHPLSSFPWHHVLLIPIAFDSSRFALHTFRWFCAVSYWQNNRPPPTVFNSYDSCHRFSTKISRICCMVVNCTEVHSLWVVWWEFNQLQLHWVISTHV